MHKIKRSIILIFLLTIFAVSLLLHVPKIKAHQGIYGLNAPDSVDAGEHFIVRIKVQYDFTGRGDVDVWARIRDPSTGGDVAHATEDDRTVKGEGSLTWSFLLTAPTTLESWRLEVYVFHWEDAQEIVDDSRTFNVEIGGEPKIEIARIQYVEPPDTIAIWETTSILVTIQYHYLKPDTAVEVNVRDMDTGSNVGWKDVTLSGSGEHVFTIPLRATRVGDWHLEISVPPWDREWITIKVVEAGTEEEGEPSVVITNVQHVRPPDTIAVGESTPVVVAIRYSNLDDVILRTRIIELDTGRIVGYKDSPSLSGNGEYTFPSIIIGSNRAGDWHLEVVVGIQGMDMASMRITITIGGAGEEGGEPGLGAFDFTLMAEPDVVALEPGGSSSSRIDVGLVNGPVEEVSLAWTIPANVIGLTVSLNPVNGIPPFTSTLNIDTTPQTSPGTYTINIAGVGNGMEKSIAVTLIIASEGQQPSLPPSGGLSTDWSVGAIWLSPSDPQPGGEVRFQAEISALTSDRGFPQRVGIAVYLDGQLIGGGPILIPQQGVAVTVSTTTPWTAISGSHTVSFLADPRSLYDDPNTGNNRGEFSFTIGEAAQPPSSFDFSITVRPESQSLRREGSIIYDVYVDLEAGTTKPVTLTLSGLPEDSTYAFDPPIGEPYYQSKLTIYVPEYTAAGAPMPAGSYTLMVTAEAGGLTRTTTATLIIAATGESVTSTQPPMTATPTVSFVQTAEPGVNLGEALRKRARMFLGLIILVIVAIAAAAYYIGKARNPKVETTPKQPETTNTPFKKLNGRPSI